MTIKAIALICLFMTGCSYNGMIRDVDCIAYYKLKTFPFVNDMPIKISKIKTDRFGRVYYRVSPNQSYVSFYGGWQPSDSFLKGNCKP